jgi:hypothetical protein
MKKLPLMAIGAVIVILIALFSFFIFSKKSNTAGISLGSSNCEQFSNKDGYTGCMSLVNGKEKKCRFKVDNKINESTQQMEFIYSCLPKQ